jgi:TrpR family trp operon transcriptional repressor
MMDKNQKGWSDFLNLCLNTKDEKTFALLFDFFLTPEEKADLTTRYLIVKELIKKEKTQREMAKDLNVSIAKITRGSNELKRTNNKLLSYLENKLS